MPLAWAHAEFLKLARSIADGVTFDTPPQTVRRYLVEKTGSPLAVWRCNRRIVTFPQGKGFRIELMAAARVRWHFGEGPEWNETGTMDTGLGIHHVDLPTEDLPVDTQVHFTLYWLLSRHWEGVDFTACVKEPGAL